MVFRDLPPEIQSRILELCSPSDLAVLSRVHTSARDIAEYTLYSRVKYRARPSDLLTRSRNRRNVKDDKNPRKLKEDKSLLHTFANNSRKASMVKMFDVELYSDNGYCGFRKATQFILGKLAEALIKMPKLVDLRILVTLHYHIKESDKGTRRISEVIRSVFRSGGVDGD